MVAPGHRRPVAACLAMLAGAASPIVAVETAFARGEVADAGQERTAPPVQTPAPAPRAQEDVPHELTPLPAPPTSPASAPDVVETIVPEGAHDGSASPVEVAAPGQEKPQTSPNRTEVAGWARESSEWMLSPTGYRQGAPSPFDVPHDRFISRTQLFVRASHVRGRWFEATVSGVLGYAFREQGPAGTEAFNGVNGQATTADSQADLRELYLGFFSTYVDFRIGQQRVAWGRADVQSPNDVLNARDTRDPILTEAELRHVPTPLIRADFDLGAVNVQLVGTPVFVPDVYDVYGTNWAAVQGDAPVPIKGLFGSVSPLFDPTKQRDYDALLHDTQRPAADWTAPSGGAKVSAVAGGVDFDFYYHYGFDSTPYVTLSPSFASFLATERFQNFRPSDLTPILQALETGTHPFSATYVRRHHIGLDIAGTAGLFAFRLDVGYDTQRVYYHTDLTSLSSPSFLGVASIEYQTGDIEKVVLLEGTYTRVVDTPDKPLLGYDQDSVGVAGTFRWPIWEGWAFELRGLVGVVPVSLALQPALRWKLSDAFLLKAGAVLLAGEENSLGWYYRHNTSGFLQAKYSF